MSKKSPCQVVVDSENWMQGVGRKVEVVLARCLPGSAFTTLCKFVGLATVFVGCGVGWIAWIWRVMMLGAWLPVGHTFISRCVRRWGGFEGECRDPGLRLHFEWNLTGLRQRAHVPPGGFCPQIHGRDVTIHHTASSAFAHWHIRHSRSRAEKERIYFPWKGSPCEEQRRVAHARWGRPLFGKVCAGRKCARAARPRSQRPNGVLSIWQRPQCSPTAPLAPSPPFPASSSSSLLHRHRHTTGLGLATSAGPQPVSSAKKEGGGRGGC